MANNNTQCRPPGSWQCVLCKDWNEWAPRCTNCNRPHPPTEIPCNKCTFLNPWDSTQCHMCEELFNYIANNDPNAINNNNNTNTSTNTNNINNNNNPNNTDNGDDDDDDDDLSILNTPPKKKPFIDNPNVPQLSPYNDNDNDNHIIDDDYDVFDDFDNDDYDYHNDDDINDIINTPPRLAATTTNISQLSLNGNLNSISNDEYIDNDDELQKALDASMIEQERENDIAAQRRLSQVYEQKNKHIFSERDVNQYNNNNNNNKRKRKPNCFDIEIMDSSPPAKKQKRSKKKQKSNNQSNSSSNSKQEMDLDDIQIIDNNNNKKAKKKQNNIYDLTQDDDDDYSHNNNDNNDIDIDSENDNDIETIISSLSKKDANQINKAYGKFIQWYIRGSYCLRTVCIEFGPQFKGKCKKFDEWLSKTDWRPKSMATNGGLKENMAFDSCINNNLPEYILRFKHHRLKTDKNLIYKNLTADKIASLSGLKKDALGNFFLPNLLDKSNSIYESYILVRLNYKIFNDIWLGKNKYYDSWNHLIKTIKELPNNGIICFQLEKVESKIDALNNKEFQQNNNNNNDDNNKKKNVRRMFKDSNHLKDTLFRYYMHDLNLHFNFSKDTAATAEYIVRVARSLADNRFNKLSINALTVSNHNAKGIRHRGTKTLKDIFFNSLVAIHNLSENIAGGITSKYQTHGQLMKAYHNLSSVTEGELLLKDIRRVGATNAKIGPAMSTKIYHIYYGNTDGNKVMD